MYDGPSLRKREANHAALSPLGFIERAAHTYPNRISIVYGEKKWRWGETFARCKKLASALQRRGIRKGDTVSVLSPNLPAVYEAHFGVPASGAILNAINTRLDPRTVSLFLWHARTKLVLVDEQLLPLLKEAVRLMDSWHVEGDHVEGARDSAAGGKGVGGGGGGGDAQAPIPPQIVVIADEEQRAEVEQQEGGRGSTATGGGAGGGNESVTSQEGRVEYEAFLGEGDGAFPWAEASPQDEWDAIALNYTSGTTSRPKGVVTHHRGAHLAALSNALIWGLTSSFSHSPSSSSSPSFSSSSYGPVVYLWTLPLFHCNGWCFPWTVAAVAGTNVCVRQVSAPLIFPLLLRHSVTHFCAAPTVLTMLLSAPPSLTQPFLEEPARQAEGNRASVAASTSYCCCCSGAGDSRSTAAACCNWTSGSSAGIGSPRRESCQITGGRQGVDPREAGPAACAAACRAPSLRPTVHVMTAGAAPPPAVLAGAERLGFSVLHTYGLTETYGPSVVCEWKGEEWEGLTAQERAARKARQGVRYPGLERLDVLLPSSSTPVPPDGSTLGEVAMAGNMVMRGYLGNEEATEEAFEGGWFRSGDLAVKHPDGYIELKDRSKDIIISGGENVSSIEVESVLYQHPAILEAAVVAKPDEKWGETVCAFVGLKPEQQHTVTTQQVIDFCRNRMPHFMAPRTVVFSELPKTATGKIQKFILRKQAAGLANGLPRSCL